MAGQTLGQLVDRARSRLRHLAIDTADLDARLIVEHFSKTKRIDALTDPHRAVDPAVADAVGEAVERRAGGESVHRILGVRDFFGLRLNLNDATLEPRPDTETVVEMALPPARRYVDRDGGCAILDLGTGSGAIALALLANVPRARAVATDLSTTALEAARSNAEELGLSDRFQAVRSDWFDSVSGQYHLIVTNPPYIRSEDLPILQPEVRLHDPVAALDGGEDGLEAYRRIAEGARAHLLPGGSVCVEIGKGQMAEVIAIFADCGLLLAESASDLSGIPRALLFGC